MSRRLNWQKAAQEAKQNADRVSGPPRIRARAAERDDGWLLRYAKHDSPCSICGEDVIAGERAYMRKRDRWEVAHEQCR